MPNFQMGSGNVINTGSGNTFAVANDHSSVVINSTGANTDELALLIAEVRKQAKSELSEEDQQAVNETLSVIEEEAKSSNPRKSFIKTALSGLNISKMLFNLAQLLQISSSSSVNLHPLHTPHNREFAGGVFIHSLFRLYPRSET